MSKAFELEFQTFSGDTFVDVTASTSLLEAKQSYERLFPTRKVTHIKEVGRIGRDTFKKIKEQNVEH